MKRIIALLLTLVLLTGVFACASQEAPQSAAEPTQEPTAEPVAAEEPTEAPAAPEEPAPAEPEPVVLTDMIGREVTVTPGS